MFFFLNNVTNYARRNNNPGRITIYHYLDASNFDCC